jgi:hypothetical protein
MLVEIARALHVDVRSFFDGIDTQSSEQLRRHISSVPAELPVTRENVSLNQAFAHIRNVRLRRIIVDLVRAVADSNSTNEDEHLQDAAE